MGLSSSTCTDGMAACPPACSTTETHPPTCTCLLWGRMQSSHAGRRPEPPSSSREQQVSAIAIPEMTEELDEIPSRKSVSTMPQCASYRDFRATLPETKSLVRGPVSGFMDRSVVSCPRGQAIRLLGDQPLEISTSELLRSAAVVADDGSKCQAYDLPLEVTQSACIGCGENVEDVASSNHGAAPSVPLWKMQDEPEPAPEYLETSVSVHFTDESDHDANDQVSASHNDQVDVELDEGSEKAEKSFNERCEFWKSVVAACILLLAWVGVLAPFYVGGMFFEEPICDSGGDVAGVVLDAPRSCEPCGQRLLFLPLFGEFENSLRKDVRGCIYMIGLLWVFLGVGIVCDQFMAAIEAITSTERVVWREVNPGAKQKLTVSVWNASVANLTLMALGSSAPEILLNIFEICSRDFFAGELGPSTIVGSAAFNLFIITGVCVIAIPAPEIRKIYDTDVFVVTASTSIFAYSWLVVILKVSSIDMVELWEALVTLAFCPILVLLAFLADKGAIGTVLGRKRKPPDENLSLETVTRSSTRNSLGPRSSRFGQNEEAGRSTKAKIRSTLMQGYIRGGAQTSQDLRPIIGFSEKTYSVLENCGTVTLHVVASRPLHGSVSIRYATVDASALAGLRYHRREGTITLGPTKSEESITIPIIDNEIFDDPEHFYVELSDLCIVSDGTNSVPSDVTTVRSGKPTTPGPTDPLLRFARSMVTIVNDDIPGTLCFDTDTLVAVRGVKSVTLRVLRCDGSAGAIQTKYITLSSNAAAGKDFQMTEGIVCFDAGQLSKCFELPIRISSDYHNETQVSFQVVLFGASPGVKFHPQTDGGDSSDVCEVIIPPSERPSCRTALSQIMWDQQTLKEGAEEWGAQFHAAFHCLGSPAEQAGAGVLDWAFHGLSLPWKLFFAFVPPPVLLGGWLCFFLALFMIGIVTAIIADLASLLGCCIGIPDDITAITLVALGTSLPDTFASKLAAVQNEYADDSIGNVTGSNCVNVFLGLGLPWTLAAVYWGNIGPSDEWKTRVYKGMTYEELYAAQYPGGGFVVPAGSLGFSVSVFSVCAFVCLAILAVRRHVYGGELGGPRKAQVRDSALLYFLWVVYVAASIVRSLSES